MININEPIRDDDLSKVEVDEKIGPADVGDSEQVPVAAEAHRGTDPDVEKGDEPATVIEWPYDVIAAEPHQAHRRLVRLASQMDRLEALHNRLLAEMQNGGDMLAVLTRHLTSPETNDPLNERLTSLVTRLETTQTQVEELTRTVAKMNRVQFKSNTLFEGKEKQVVQTLNMLQEIVFRREEITEAQTRAQHQHLEKMRAEARAVFAADMLPILDGLEHALMSGRALLERQRVSGARSSSNRKGLWHAVQNIFSETPDRDYLAEVGQVLSAWLDGLDLVSERFRKLLALENIHPISALHQTFNPRLHVAVATEVRADVKDGTIQKVLRTGYRHGARVLRYAEVVVARMPAQDEAGRDPTPPTSDV